jgi:hypothetical protein
VSASHANCRTKKKCSYNTLLEYTYGCLKVSSCFPVSFFYLSHFFSSPGQYLGKIADMKAIQDYAVKHYDTYVDHSLAKVSHFFLSSPLRSLFSLHKHICTKLACFFSPHNVSAGQSFRDEEFGEEDRGEGSHFHQRRKRQFSHPGVARS